MNTSSLGANTILKDRWDENQQTEDRAVILKPSSNPAVAYYSKMKATNSLRAATLQHQDVTNIKNRSIKQYCLDCLSYFRYQCRGEPDLANPDDVINYIKKRCNLPFSERLLINHASHDQRVEIIKHNGAYSYELIFYKNNAQNYAKENYVDLYTEENQLWHDFFSAEGVPEDVKDVLRHEKKSPVYVKITPSSAPVLDDSELTNSGYDPSKDTQSLL